MTTIADLEIVVTGDTSEAEAKLSGLSKKLQGFSTGDLIGAAGVFGGISAAVGGFFTSAISTAADFEQALSNVGSVGGADAIARMDEIRAKALELGASTVFSATEAAAGIEELVKAGVPVQTILDGAGQSVLDFAAAVGVEVPWAAELMADSMNTFGISATEVGDVLAQTANASSASVEGLAYSLKHVGPVAAALGIPFDELNAYLGILSENGIKGEQAGTSLRNMLTSLSAPTAEQAELLNQLGISAFDSSGQFRGMNAVVSDLQGVWADLTQEQKMNYAETLVGKEGMAAFLALMGSGPDAFNDMMAAMDNAGTASSMAQERMNNLNGAMEELGGAFETAQIIIGSMFIPVIRFLAESLTRLIVWFANLSPKVQEAVSIFAMAVGVVAAVAAAFIGASLAGGVFAAVMAVLLSPIILIVAALAALGAGLFVLYRNNKAFAAWVNKLAGNLKDLAKDGFNRLTKEAKKLQPVISAVGNFFRGPFVSGVKALVPIVVAAASAFLKFQTLMAQGVLKTITQVVSFLSGVFVPVFFAVKDAVSQFVEGLLQVLTASGAVSAAFEFITTAVDAAKAAFTTIVGAVQSVVEAFGEGGLMGAIRALPQALSTIGSALLGLGSTILNALLTAIGSIDWGMLRSYGADLINGLWNGVQSAWDAGVSFLSDLGSKAVFAVKTLTPYLLSKGIELIQGLWDGVQQHWPTVVTWLGGIASKAVAAVPVLTSYLLAKGIELIQGLWNGLEQNWPTVLSWLQGIGSKVIAAVPVMASYLLSKGIELVQGIWDGLQQHWPTVVSWLGGIGSKAVAAIGNLSAYLLSKGIELIQGLWDGVKSMWESVKGWFSGLKDKVLAALPQNPGSMLTDVGKSIITSLKRGFEQAWGDVLSWVADKVNGLIDQFNKMPGVSIPKIEIDEASWGSAGVTVGAAFANNALQNIGLIWNWLTPSGGGGGSGYDLQSLWGDEGTLVGGKFTTGVNTGITNGSPSVTSALQTAMTNATIGVGDQSATLQPRGLELMTGLKSGISTGDSGVQTRLKLLKAAMVLSVGNQSSTLTSTGTSLMMGLAVGIAQGFATVTAYLSLTGSKAITAVGSLTGTLNGRGRELMTGLRNGATGAWGTVSSWLSGIGSRAAGAVGGVSGALVGAGRNLIAGLISGMNAMAGSAYATAQSIANGVAAIMRSALAIRSPSRVTMYLGEMVGAGLIAGMRDSLRDINLMSGQLAMAATPVPYQAPASVYTNTQSNRTNNVTINLHIDNIDRYEDAAKFADELKREFQLA